MKLQFQRSVIKFQYLSQVSALGSEVGRKNKMGFTLHLKPFKLFSYEQSNCPIQPRHPLVVCTPHCTLQYSSHISTYCLLSVVSAFQTSAMKPHTCAIMTPESHGDESTSVMWNSAHVWQGKSSVKESTTHVRSSCYSTLTVSCFYSVVSFCWDDKSET